MPKLTPLPACMPRSEFHKGMRGISYGDYKSRMHHAVHCRAGQIFDRWERMIKARILADDRRFGFIDASKYPNLNRVANDLIKAGRKDLALDILKHGYDFVKQNRLTRAAAC